MPRKTEGKALIRISARGVAKNYRNASDAQRVAHDWLFRTLVDIANDGVEILQDYAPENTGRLRSQLGIVARRNRMAAPSIEIGLTGDLDPGGYDYFMVTRRGRHAVRPKRKSVPSEKLGTYKRPKGSPLSNRLKESSAALGIRLSDGSVIARGGAAEWKPASDWVADAVKEIKEIAEIALEYKMRGMGQELQKVLAGRKFRIGMIRKQRGGRR